VNKKMIVATAAAMTLGLAGCGNIDTTNVGSTTSKASKSDGKKSAGKTDKSTAPDMTKAQEQAIGSAEDYLSFSGFSKQGLIQQLTQGESFSKKDATYAVNHIDVNWKKQAAKSAEDYLSISHFSHQGLIDQLMQGDGYTKAQAEYGVDQAGL
jgi:hypothetical protein